MTKKNNVSKRIMKSIKTTVVKIKRIKMKVKHE